jgi:ribosomal protein L5
VRIYKRKNYEKYEARIKVNKVVINLGNFNTVEEALQAHKAAELLYL